MRDNIVPFGRATSHAHARPTKAADRPRDFPTYESKSKILHMILREWWVHLSPPEPSVLMWIYDKTIEYGWSCAFLTYRFMERGASWGCGTGYCKSSLINHIGTLEAKGVLFIERSQASERGSHYQINLNWKPQVLMVSGNKRRDTTTQHETSVSGATDEMDGWEVNQPEGGAKTCTTPVQKLAPL